jgi:hypothetical protein
MSQQIKFNTPSGDWCAVDNSSAPTFPTLSAGTHLGYDTSAPGSTTQVANPYGNTGSTTLDTVNDTIVPNPRVATVSGNPVQNTQPTYAKVSTVINDAIKGIRVLFKSPA